MRIHLAGKLGTSNRALWAEKRALDARRLAEAQAIVRERLTLRAAWERNRALAVELGGYPEAR